MTTPRTRIWVRTALLFVAIIALGFVLFREQRRTARLREALVVFQTSAHGRIYGRLNRPIFLGSSPTVPWNEEIGLRELIRDLEVFTKQPNFAGLSGGLPIEADPAGLNEVGQSLQSRVKLPPAPKVEISIPELLERVLGPLGLAFRIDDGKLLLTSRQAVERSHERLARVLDERIPLTWGEDSSLNEVIKEFNRGTRGGEFPMGLPIYLDEGAETAISDEQVAPVAASDGLLSIREYLRRVLEPNGLRFEFRAGALMITARDKPNETVDEDGRRFEKAGMLKPKSHGR
jgi:hypothetical protein